MGTMYKPQNNGPHTELAATINAGQTSITVTNASVLPEAPNVLTIGTEEDAELVEVQSITGNILTVQRGFNGTTAKAWDAGTWIYRGITAQDIEELQERTKKIVKTLTDAEFEALTTEEKAALFASGTRLILITKATGQEGTLETNAYSVNSDGTATLLVDPSAVKDGKIVARAAVAADAEMLGGMLPSEFAKAGETGGVTMELLWENASPNSEFERQEFTIAGAENYELFLLITSQASGFFVFDDQYRTTSTATAWNEGEKHEISSRVYVARSTFSILFSNCMSAAAGANASISKVHQVPLKIYGIKGMNES